ncbi:DUF3500 domain-containing protein [Actinoplanes sp. URMC 104]|uniref:DUF3500 domain-containing protein n=1 Tax=Actinoplanes sp. URMC 104 TaxID=3423409 RepID=UPI003F1A131A
MWLFPPQLPGAAARMSRIAAAGLVAASLAACGNDEASSPSSSSSSSAASYGSDTKGIVAAANAFLGTLSSAEKDSVLFDRGDKEQQQRWSNFPEGLFTRQGLMVGNLDQSKVDAFLTLMRTTMSTEGYNRVMAEWAADDALAATDSSGQGTASGGANNGSGGPPSGGFPGGSGGRPSGGFPGGSGGPPNGADRSGANPGTGQSGAAPGAGTGGMQYGKQYYWMAIIGEPSDTEAWQWQFGGHHVTVNATVKGDDVSMTPSFIGAQPGTYTADGTEVRPLGDIIDEATALVNSLDAGDKKKAVLGDRYIDLVLGPGEDCKTIPSEGLAGADMSADQQAAFLELIDEYGSLANDQKAADRLAQLKTDLPKTYFAWYGPTTAGSSSYFRVTGPHLVIEYSPQSMGGDAADHIHGIYRDPTNDYGGTVCS